MNDFRYCVAAIGHGGRLLDGCYYYPFTEEGLKMANSKRAELIAKYLFADVVVSKSSYRYPSL